MNLMELSKSIVGKRKNDILIESIIFQRRLFMRICATDYPLLEKLNMTKIIHNNIVELFSMKLCKGGRKVNKIAEKLILDLYTDISKMISKSLQEYFSKNAHLYNAIDTFQDIDSIIEKEKIITIKPYYKEFDQLVIMCNKDINSTNPEFFIKNEIPIDKYGRFMWLTIPNIMANISELTAYIKERLTDKDGNIVETFAPAIVDDRVYNLNEIAEQDIVIRTPYQSYDAVLYFIRSCLAHPNLDLIFMTLYRTAENSKIVNMLCEASKVFPHKTIIVYVEPNASGDEERNSIVVQKLKDAGVRVYYENEFKIHGKMFIATSTKPEMRSFAHFATGNYNENSARCYTDMHLLTADYNKILPAVYLFAEHICVPKFSHIDMRLTNCIYFSPINMKSAILGMIKAETNKGPEGKIVMKMNSLADTEIIEYLSIAALAGVKIRLIVRSICLVNTDWYNSIEVESYCGRYLEHDRIYQFGDRIFIGSADLSFRNMHKRIELLVEINQPESKKYALETLANLYELNEYRFVKRQNLNIDDNSNANKIHSQWKFERLANIMLDGHASKVSTHINILI